MGGEVADCHILAMVGEWTQAEPVRPSQHKPAGSAGLPVERPPRIPEYPEIGPVIAACSALAVERRENKVSARTQNPMNALQDFQTARKIH